MVLFPCSCNSLVVEFEKTDIAVLDLRLPLALSTFFPTTRLLTSYFFPCCLSLPAFFTASSDPTKRALV